MGCRVQGSPPYRTLALGWEELQLPRVRAGGVMPQICGPVSCEVSAFSPARPEQTVPTLTVTGLGSAGRVMVAWTGDPEGSQGSGRQAGGQAWGCGPRPLFLRPRWEWGADSPIFAPGEGPGPPPLPAPRRTHNEPYCGSAELQSPGENKLISPPAVRPDSVQTKRVQAKLSPPPTLPGWLRAPPGRRLASHCAQRAKMSQPGGGRVVTSSPSPPGVLDEKHQARTPADTLAPDTPVWPAAGNPAPLHLLCRSSGLLGTWWFVKRPFPLACCWPGAPGWEKCGVRRLSEEGDRDWGMVWGLATRVCW